MKKTTEIKIAAALVIAASFMTGSLLTSDIIRSHFFASVATISVIALFHQLSKTKNQTEK